MKDQIELETAPDETDDEDRVALLAEALHAGWRKGTDGPYAMTIWKLIEVMSIQDWGEYVGWVDRVLGEVGYSPAERLPDETGGG